MEEQKVQMIDAKLAGALVERVQRDVRTFMTSSVASRTESGEALRRRRNGRASRGPHSATPSAGWKHVWACACWHARHASVAPTDAGEQLISRLSPALGDVESVLDQIVGLRKRPAGRVRLLCIDVLDRM
jgi:hypothetical protein